MARNEDDSRRRDRDSSRDRDTPSRGRNDDGARGGSRGDAGGRGGRDRPRFSYQSRDAADVKKRAEGDDGKYDVYIDSAVKTFKVNDGDNTIRILPPTWDNPTHYGMDIHVHYGIGPDRQSYLCPHKMKDEPCPICEERAKAVRDGDEAYAKELNATKRVLVYIVDRDAEKEGVQAWAMPNTLDRDMVKVSVDKRSGEVLPLDHPEEGFDVMFEKKGAQMRTEYLGVQLARRASELGDDAWLDFAIDHPLPTMLKFYSYEHIQAAFSGGAPASRGRDESHSAGSRSTSRDQDDSDSRRGRGRDEPNHSRAGESSDELTYESVHAMTGTELEDLIAAERLSIKPNDAVDDEELAGWICADLKLEKKARSTGRTSLSREEAAPDRLRNLRERR